MSKHCRWALACIAIPLFSVWIPLTSCAGLPTSAFTADLPQRVLRLPALPEPVLPARRVQAETPVALAGKQTCQRSAGAAESGDTLTLVSHPGESEFGMYEIDVADGTLIQLSFAGSLEPGMEYWVAISAYDTGTWFIDGPVTTQDYTHVFEVGDWANTAGNFYCAAITVQGNSYALDSVTAIVDLPESVPTYAADMAEIFRIRCQGCHHSAMPAGGISLDNYISAKANAAAALAAVESDSMPPGIPLDDGQKGLLAAWVAGGTPSGYTYTADVLPLVFNTYCLDCHAGALEAGERSGAPLGVDFDTYAAAADNGVEANDEVQAETMPPASWGPPLDIFKKAYLKGWIDDGLPE
jgi:mono/diheme cytochrome c family protein